MELLLTWSDVWKQFAPYIMTVCILSVVGLIGKLALFSKANQPYWAAFVPFYDVIITMRLVGRPDAHALRLFIFGSLLKTLDGLSTALLSYSWITRQPWHWLLLQ